MKLVHWIQSYQNHVIHCSICLVVGMFALKNAQTSDSALVRFMYQSILGFLSLVLYLELDYVWKRTTLPPGDSGMPLVGNVPQMIQFGPRKIFIERYKKYGSPSTNNMMMTPTLVVSDDDDVNWWLAQERKGNATGSVMPHIQRLIGQDAIMFQSQAHHRRLRRIFEPSFSPVAVKEYMETIDRTAQEQLEKWNSTGDFQSSKEWSFLAMRLFFSCAFGHVEEDLLETLNRLFLRWLSGFHSICPFPIPGTCLYKAHVAKGELAAVLLKMVEEFKRNNPPGSPGAETTMMGRLCYALDDQGKPLTNSQLISNIQFILFAGHDTTKGSFCAFAHYLAAYPHIRKLLVEEVQSFSEPLNVDELKSAPILNAFMAETWRLVPPLGGHVLRAQKDIEFKGYTVRKGVGIILSIQGYNIMPQGRYKDPQEFRIERWLPKGHPLYDPVYFQDGVNYNAMSSKYRAFSMGAHSCLGAHFAKMEARVVLTRLLQSYEIDIKNDALITFPLLQHDNSFKVSKRGTKPSVTH